MFYKYDEDTACVDYRIFVKDNYSNNEYVNRYDGSFWIPRIEDCAKYDGVGGNRTVEIVGEELTEDTLKSDKYGFTQTEVDQIASALDSDYKDECVFYWG